MLMLLLLLLVVVPTAAEAIMPDLIKVLAWRRRQ